MMLRLNCIGDEAVENHHWQVPSFTEENLIFICGGYGEPTGFLLYNTKIIYADT